MGYQMIDEAGCIVRTIGGGLDDWQVRWLGGFNPPAPHPTYFFVRAQGDGTLNLYDETYHTAQDFELWSRLSLQGRTEVLPDVLIRYRRHPNAITVRKRREQAANCARTGVANLKRRLPPEIVRQLCPLLALFATRRSQTETQSRLRWQGATRCWRMTCNALRPRDTAAGFAGWPQGCWPMLSCLALAGFEKPRASRPFCIMHGYICPLSVEPSCRNRVLR